MNDTLNAELRYSFICVLLGKLTTSQTTSELFGKFFFFFFAFYACRLTGNFYYSEKMPGLYMVLNVLQAYIFFYRAVYLVALSPQDMKCLNIQYGSFSFRI